MTSGGASRMQVAARTRRRRPPRARAATQRLQRGVRLRARARAARASRGRCTSSTTANRPWPPRTSPITGCRGLHRVAARAQHARAERARALDQALVLVGLDRRDAGRAGERMAAVGEAGVEHLVLERAPPPRATARRRRAARARRSGPWRASSGPGAPASPWRCHANHSPQRPKPLITSSAIR